MYFIKHFKKKVNDNFIQSIIGVRREDPSSESSLHWCQSPTGTVEKSENQNYRPIYLINLDAKTSNKRANIIQQCVF